MTRIIKAVKVQETHLWKILSEREGEDANTLSTNVVSLCEEAVDRMKAMYVYAPEYTLHDDRHLLRTTELMGRILGTQVQKLNSVEIALLILSAFFHDQGMVLSEEEYKSLAKDEKFQLFKSNWLLEHPNYGETASQINSTSYNDNIKNDFARQLAELDAALIIDYIRQTHGHRTGEFINSTYESDKRIEIQTANLSPFLSKICEAHTLSNDSFRANNGFRYDELIGTYSVNIPYLAVILRIADILDFDRDRTPEALLKSIHFTSPVSLHEWEKHRSVEGWQISCNNLRFSVKCKHPSYEAAVRKYMDWIDMEITLGEQVCRLQPRDINGYQLNLPPHVDRSRIEPLDDSYRYYDLEFSLSRDEVVRLLMTDNLYGKEHLCVRELLQNSMDALRYRKALFLDASTHWDDGKVKFKHYVNKDGYEVLECKDNGAGMDEEIIRNHLVKVGRSFYRSPVFEREINRLKASGNDFDPCSQFGIGFMSCFMLGDRITIQTRRDFGVGRDWGTPLIVEINGLGGLLIVREGQPEQPIGTTVSIVSRQKPSFLDSWSDRVKLCTILEGYALATEFPIHADCLIPEIKETLSVPPIIERTPTLLEVAQVKNCILHKQDLSNVSPLLRGYVQESFLTDKMGLPCLANSEAEWCGIDSGARKEWTLKFLNTEIGKDYDYDKYRSVPVCMDGILIAGPPGRHTTYKKTRMHLGELNSNIYSNSPAIADVRGDLKPEITPGRTPPSRIGINLPPGWRRLRETFKKGLGLLWSEIVDYLQSGLSPEMFWKLSIVYNFSIGWIPAKKLTESLSVSLTKDDDPATWILAKDIGEMSIHNSENSFILKDREGRCVGPASTLRAWEEQGEKQSNLSWHMNSCVLLMSCLDVRDGKISITPFTDPHSNIHLAIYANISVIGVNMFMIPYSGNAVDALSVQTPYPTANRLHPLVDLFHKSRHTKAKTDIEVFANSFVQCISETLSTKKESPSLEKPDYWQKRVGHLYFSVNWDRIEESLCPPYKLWVEDRGWFSFGKIDFEKWRDSPARMK